MVGGALAKGGFLIVCRDAPGRGSGRTEPSGRGRPAPARAHARTCATPIIYRGYPRQREPCLGGFRWAQKERIIEVISRQKRIKDDSAPVLETIVVWR